MNPKVIVVGAGPAGLAIAGHLTQLRIPYLLLEKSDKAVSSWHQHYDRLHLHTVKRHSNLPFKNLPESYPTYASKNQMIDYWNSYVTEMGIQPLYNQEVKRIEKQQNLWKVSTATHEFMADAVVVATGYNREPFMPTYENHAIFKGDILHSREYKNGKPFAGKKVLLIGMGNTGAELAIDLVEHGAFPTISIRDSVIFIKRDFIGIPTQETAVLMGKLPNRIYDWIATQIQRIAIGDLSEFGIKKSKYAPSEQLRELGRVPVIDIGTLKLIRSRQVLIKPSIQHFNEDCVTFSDYSTENFDAIIFCTGYRAKVEDFFDNSASFLNERGYPKALWFEEESLRGLYFCGFSVPLSGILRNIKMDSEAIARHLQKFLS